MTATPVTATLMVEADGNGWPASAAWPGMSAPLFTADTGTFQSVAITGFAGRWTSLDVFNTGDREQRDKLRSELLEVVPATAAEPARVERTPYTTVYTQLLSHPRCRWLSRRLELWNNEPRAMLTLRLHRTEGELPEIFFVGFTLPCENVLPAASNGGLPFVPYRDQLPGTCRDYFAIDSWLDYSSPAGQWLWVTRDAPLVTFGDHHVLARTDEPPKETHRILAMVFNNLWFTNFVADSHGALEFEFALTWRPPDTPSKDMEGVAETLQSEPTIVINPQLREDPIFMRRLHQ